MVTANARGREAGIELDNGMGARQMTPRTNEYGGKSDDGVNNAAADDNLDLTVKLTVVSPGDEECLQRLWRNCR